jgi:hypothetical protein
MDNYGTGVSSSTKVSVKTGLAVSLAELNFQNYSFTTGASNIKIKSVIFSDFF